MEEDYPAWEEFAVYDSSGMEMFKNSEDDIGDFTEDMDFEIPYDLNPGTSVGEYFETE